MYSTILNLLEIVRTSSIIVNRASPKCCLGVEAVLGGGHSRFVVSKALRRHGIVLPEARQVMRMLLVGGWKWRADKSLKREGRYIHTVAKKKKRS